MDQLPPGAQDLLRFEQLSVNRAGDTQLLLALVNHQDPRFAPETGAVFPVRSAWLPADLVTVFGDATPPDIPGLTLSRMGPSGQTEYLLLIHPESEGFYERLSAGRPEGPRFFASSTASSRTLLMWEEGRIDRPFFGKLSLNKEIGGVVRTIPRGEIARSIGTNQILRHSQSQLPQDFGFLPEVFGMIPTGWERGGMLIRALPERYLTGDTRLIPLFSLGIRQAGHPLSPIELMAERAGVDVQQFFLERVLDPFARQWVSLAIDHGIAIESHGQNVLLEVDSHTARLRAFVYRDFGGFNTDLSHRRSNRLPMPTRLPVIADEASDYHQAHHTEALISSLRNYFVAGFLFGLVDATRRLPGPRPQLSYEDLRTQTLHLIAAELSRRGAPVNQNSFRPDRDFQSGYSTVVASALSVRTRTRPQMMFCADLSRTAAD